MTVVTRACEFEREFSRSMLSLATVFVCSCEREFF